MNTGLHDVWNLAWKLDLFLRGNGKEELLDSYEQERLPVIRSVIHTTDTLTKVMGTPNKLAQVMRDLFIPMVSRLVPFQHAFVERLSELGISYGGSPIVEGPGARWFDDSVRGGQGICGRFLLMINDADGAAHEAAKPLLESFRGALESRQSARTGITLVRPDGYVATSSRHGGKDAIQSARAVLERQLTESERTRGVG